ncbi:protein Shroom4 isoform 2-T2 [Leptodactylus fuscus]|uniref:protein Shroom4 isoform X2 n=1 Tax=Leptodactylus fuscus TaxID=238119 RepID=UPI003F4E73C4
MDPQEPLQHVHVLLQGGAPWGFTLQGGLEHGGPLIISKIEDGGKAAKCEKIEVGDELVNINGTPLHGSRQEALILIKGSYKILKMIVRRRSALVIRPHSWHLAKLSEVHPDVASMQYPSDAFSMSWHSGTEISEHSLHWNIFSRHCSTDKSSSIGSMESLDQPGQNYYEGTLSPLDPCMHQNKRDSAYSSFSTSSNISDYTVSAKMDESSPINNFLGSNKQEDDRYLQTGLAAVDSQVDISNESCHEHFHKVSRLPYNEHNLDNISSPPQPPIRRDSLRENKNKFCNRERKSSTLSDSIHMPVLFSPEAGQFNSSENAFCQCTNGPCAVHFKENLSSEQYYMLSSQTDNVKKINTFAKDEERQPSHCPKLNTNKLLEDDIEKKVFNYNNIDEVACNIDSVAAEMVKNSDCEHWKLLCIPSTQINMSSSEASFTNDSSSADYHYPTDTAKEENRKSYKCTSNKDLEISKFQNTEQTSDTSAVHLCPSLDRIVSISNDPKEASASQPNNYDDELSLTCISNALIKETSKLEETGNPNKKPGSSRNRSSQMRRKSDRFATNLRNEIQRRKAQLQKNKGSIALPSGEDSVEDKDYPLESHSESIPHPSPPPPAPPKNKALLLEIKRANAEKYRSTNDCLYQGKQEDKMIDKNTETHEHTSNKAIISLKEALTEDEGLLLPSQNITCNEKWNSNAADTHHEEYVFPKPNQNDQQKNTEHKYAYSTGNFQNAINLAQKPESVLKEWAPIVPNKPGSLDMWKIENKISIDSIKKQRESKGSLGLEQKLSTKASDHLASENQPLPETLDKLPHVDNTYNITDDLYDSERKWRLKQFTSEQPVEERELIDQANLGQVNKVHISRRSDTFSSPTPIKSPQQFLDFQNHISQHNQNDEDKLTWSPEHNFQTQSYIRKEAGHKLKQISLQENVPHTSRMSDENILLPFAARRKFFEDVSKQSTSSTMHEVPKENFCPSRNDNTQTMITDPSGHFVEHTHFTASPRRQDGSLPHYDLCMNHTVNPTMCCNQGKHSADYLPSFIYGCRACVFCCSELCPALLKRNLPVTHHSCHCQHHHQHHHHHQWKNCADFMCPTQYNLLEEGSSPYVDRWHIRNPLLQDVSMKEGNPHLKFNRKCSQSVSDLYHFPSGTQHSGLLKPCCGKDDYKWSQGYKTTSSCDCSSENLLRPLNFASFQDGQLEPHLSRTRAYSVNQLNLEYLPSQDRIESPTIKLEDRESNSQLKKRGPPRPPPPQWEKYKEYQASRQTNKSGIICKERSASENNGDTKDARQRSQSLPMDKTSFSVESNLFPAPVHGFSHVKELSEIRFASQGPQMNFPTAFPRLNASSSPDSKEADGCDAINQPFCSESITLTAVVHEGQCSADLEEIFEDEFRHSEDDWSTDRESEISIPERYDEFQAISPTLLCGTVSPTTCATYYNTSTAKADLLNRMKKVGGDQEEKVNVTEVEDEENEFTYKKVQLIESISRKLSVLHKAQEELQEDISANVTLGCEMENLLKSVCKPNEYDKFRIFIGDMDKVVSLLLSLSGRLSRVEVALNCDDPEPSVEEKMNLLEKKKQLTEQLEDAKELKAHVTRREQIVLEMISKYLNDEQLQDYHHYVKMTSALIVEQRELEDKIQLGEEQLRCLRESL